MKRITISLPDDLADSIARTSRIRRKSVSEVVRASLKKDLGPDGGQRRDLPFANIAKGDGEWNAADLDTYLAQNWAKDIERDMEQ